MRDRSWDSFIAGFDKPEPRPELDSDDVSIFEELDELHDQRFERGDAEWYPANGDLARLVLERRARMKR